MRRFFFRPAERSADLVYLSAAESHHIWRVLRLQAGMIVELFDGAGGIHEAELLEVGPRVTARIIASSEDSVDGDIPLWVGQGVLKAKNMDMVVQKCTELGVRGLVPVVSSRCQGRTDLLREQKREDRWLKIIEESCKQCRRTRPMELTQALDFREAIEYFASGPGGMDILFWEEESKVHLHDLEPLAGAAAVHLLLGPEGGFAQEEVAVARGAGWRTVSLGRRILRAETATLASIAVVQHLLRAI